VASQSFATLKALDEALGERCRTLAAMPPHIKNSTNHRWWPKLPQGGSPPELIIPIWYEWTRRVMSLVHVCAVLAEIAGYFAFWAWWRFGKSA
jgi:hypothetical protein